MRDKTSLNRNITSASLYLFDKMDFFYYLVMCKCMSTTVHGNGTVQFSFFIMRLNITIITSCDSLIIILAT